MSFIKKRSAFFTHDELVEFNKIKSLMECIAWHMKYTPWFNEEINLILAKEDWGRKEEINKQKDIIEEKKADK